MRKVTGVIIGAGLRGALVYGQYALDYPNEFEIVAVAEPRKDRREATAKAHHLPKDKVFESYEALLERPVMADCAIIGTQDRMHFEPVKLAMEKGYHVLCEKPMSPEKNEIVEMGQLAKKHHRILSICHVLRYSSFFQCVKGLVKEGRIGELRTISHMEEVGFWHQAHSFVRGNWRDEKETSPMILAKCCHDMDIISWLVESPCRQISSFGSLSYFTRDNAPEDAPEYCLMGCGHREECPFYAPGFYLEHPRAVSDDLTRAVTPEESPEAILEALKTSPYGRCVFRCDNNVVDHQIVNMAFENQVIVSLIMSGFTRDCKREIRLMGTRGEIQGDMEKGLIIVRDFISGREDTVRLNTSAGGHSGSDRRMMRDFVRLLGREAGKGSASDGEVSVESHLMALAAEESRREGRSIDFQKYKAEVYHGLLEDHR